MKLALDPMPAVRKAAEDQVNLHFSRLAAETLHRDQAHAAKRAHAADILRGGAATPEFAEEAALRQLSATELAQAISGKPDLSAARELARQKMMLAIGAARTPADIGAVLAGEQGSTS